MTPPDRGQIRCVTTRGADVISKLGWGAGCRTVLETPGTDRPKDRPSERGWNQLAPSRGGNTTRGTVAGVAPDEQGA